MDVVIVDYGMGNVGSIANMLRKLGARSTVSQHPDEVAAAPRLVLPGVGAFDLAVEHLETRGLIEPVRRCVQTGAPVLGICLGMQLLADASEEGERSGFGLIPGRVRRLPGHGPDGPLRVPHMGWNRATPTRPSPLFADRDPDARYYFVHSFAFAPTDDAHVLATTVYGLPFASAVARDNVVGVQFHPEKSHRHGMALLRGWLEA